MRIKKYALGSEFTPIVSELLVQPAEKEQAATKATPEATKEGFDFTKEVFNIISSTNGIPIDQEGWASIAGSVYDIVYSPTATDREKVNALMRLQLEANKVTQNKNLYDTVIKKVATEDLSNDLAMDSRGNFYALSDSGDIVTVDLNTIKSNPSKYQMLTINELLKFRRGEFTNLDTKNQYLAYTNYDILTDINGTTGIKEVMTQVVDIVSKIGTETTKGYAGKVGNNVKKGLEYLFAPMSTEYGIQLASYDGLYELKQTDSNAAKSIDAAISYIYSHLNENAKNAVRAQAFLRGFDSPTDLIELAIIENISSSTELSYVKPDDDSKGKKGSGSGGSESLAPETWAHGVFLGTGLPTVDNMTINGNLRMSLPSKVVPNVLDKDGNQLGVTRLSQSYMNFQDQGLVDTSGSVYFGDIELNSPALEGYDIIVDNSYGMHITEMPVDNNGEINWNLYNIMNDIQSEIIKNNITDDSERARIWAENGFGYNTSLRSGVPVGMNTRKFIVQKAYTSTKSDYIDSNELKNSDMLSEAKKGVLEHLGLQYALKPSVAKDKFDLEAGMFGTNYEGMIYIPMTANENDVVISNKQGYIPKINSNEIKAMQDAMIYSGGYNSDTRKFNVVTTATVDDL